MAIVDIEAGSKASSQLLNDNFHYLQDLVGELSIKIDGSEATVDSKIATSRNSLQSEISALETEVDNSIKDLETKVNNTSSTVDSTLKGRVFKQSAKSIGIGTTSLSSYLPNDGYAYLVWVYITVHGTSTTGTNVNIKTDVLTTARTFAITDGDSGRYSTVRTVAVVPVGKGRSITTSSDVSKNVDGVTLIGYAKM